MQDVTASPFLIWGDRDFVDRRGRTVRPVFRGADAQVALVPAGLAEALRSGPEGIDGLAPDECAALLASGLAVTDVSGQRQDVLRKIAQGNVQAGLRTFVLLPTSYCNMACDYCGQEHTRRTAAGQHRDAVVRRVVTAMHDARTNAVHVAWFGGEPLMAFAVLRDMAARICSAADASGVEFTSKITTNGALLDRRKFHALVHTCLITRFDITLDGQAAVHDVHRPLKSGRPSFERLVSFLADVAGDPEFSHVQFVLRTNVDRRNASTVDGYLRAMAARGFGRDNVTFQLAPIHSWGNDISGLELARDEVAELEIAWFRQMRTLGLRFAVLPTATSEAVCVATTRHSEVISADGAVYSCTEHPLVPGQDPDSALIPLQELGPAALRPTGKHDAWDDELATGTTPCSRCALLPVCGGHCPKLWSEGIAACPSMKTNMPQRLSFVAETAGLSPAAQTPVVVAVDLGG